MSSDQSEYECVKEEALAAAAAAASAMPPASVHQHPASYGGTMGGPSVKDDNLEDPPRALSPPMEMALSYQRRRQHPGSFVLPSEAAARRQSYPAGGGNDVVDADILSGGGPLAVDVFSQSLLSQSYHTAERFFEFLLRIQLDRFGARLELANTRQIQLLQCRGCGSAT